ncbi:NAD(P)/FAD-dependent oxidoreductase [Rhodoferax ferrireducens]|uniref:NAD(P)/FAD-dependent oxidoreductase n=1 Tax=Rhodoferax ferrireducens TaxID=192843 RepID=UPI000E0DC777|nr:NAD(P)-binding protein [Rhodoferax ferrireducens]
MLTDLIQIGGAGPAGLAAAITLARAGRRVLVHELQGEVGHRFGGDFQGLENWSTQHDVLDQLREAGIGTAFTAKACSRAEVFDAWGNRYEIESNKTFFYLVERGPGPGTLDTALLEQARGLGVEVRFNSRLDRLEGAGILAAGPKAADAIAVGYHFETPMDDGVWVILDDELAPQGYAYLLIMNGRGTVKSCMFSGFKQEHLYVQRTVAAFQRLVGLEMLNPRLHGGVGNFHMPARAVTGGHPVVGEAAGFQDFLWGFGMRYAIHSGVLAARSLLEGKYYDMFWRLELEPPMWNSMVNRALFGLLGNRGYRWILRRNQAQRWDAHRVLQRLYQPWPIKRLLLPWARTRYSSRRQDESCDHINCTCVWCRHGNHHLADAQKGCGG